MDKNKLYAAFTLKGLSVGEVCKALNMCRSTFYRKSRGLSSFSQAEIKRLIEILDIKDPNAIFFTNDVSRKVNDGAVS